MNNGEKTPKILLTRKLPEAAEKAFANTFDCTFNPADKPMTSQEILAAAEGFDGLAVTSMDKFPAEIIKALPGSVRIMATVSVGHEHIDHHAARSRNIATTNTPDVLTDATADIALLLLLGAARGAHWGERMIRENRWPPPSMVTPLGSDVSGQRLGILGMGRIGQAVAKRASAFGMTIHYHNRKAVDDSLAPGATFHASFESMLPHCDFLSVNCAMTPETKGLINARTLALLPRGAIVVNTARGGVVDDDSLIAALQSGHIAAAGLDVFANEPNLDPRYRTLENTFLLPHLGSATLNTRTKMALKALDNLKDFFSGKKPRDQFN
ncbi:MAG: D-glycerate dehydrogenase [Proteobacteria bacterium]|nr:D-glycerate dehydrogenase [Pseudomonadota bacterium]